MSSRHLTKNHVFHACTNHFEIHYHFIKKLVLVDDVNLVHVNTRQLQIRDVFTKALGIRIRIRIRIFIVHKERTLSTTTSDSKQRLEIPDEELVEWPILYCRTYALGGELEI